MSSVLETAVLRGELVTLRPLEAADAHAAFPMLHGRQPVLRWLEWYGPASEEELVEHYSRWIAAGEDGADYRLAIVENATGAFVGALSIRFIGHPGVGDVGYWLGEQSWGRGYMTEALRLAAHLAFEHLSADSLCAWVFRGNVASRVVLERCGFSVVRPEVERHGREGAVQVQSYHALTASEWRRREDGWQPAFEDVRR